MLKHKLYIFILFLVSVLSFSCAKVNDQTQQGFMNLSLTERDENLILKSISRKYKITILNEKGETVYVDSEKNSVEKLMLFAGKYTVKAESGTAKDADFDSPHYYGEKEIEIIPNQIADIEIETKLTGIKFTVVYGEELKQYFSSYSTTVSYTGTTKKLIFTQENTKPGYFKVNPASDSFSWNTEFLAFGGQPFILQGTIPNVKANDHYIITFKLEEGSYESGGVRVIAIVVNENTTNQGDTNLDLDIKRFPEAVGVGFDINQVKNISKTDADQSLIIDFAGFPSLKSVEVSYECAPLSSLDTEGKYKVFDLVGALNSPTTLADLREDLHLDMEYITTPGCQNGVRFDLTRLTEGISAAEGIQAPYTFTFKITDASGAYVFKTLTFNVINSSIETLQPKRWEIWSKRATVSGRWKENKPTSMNFRVWSENGPDIAILNNVTVDETNKTFKVDVTGLTPSTTYYVQSVGVFSAEKTDRGNIVTIKTEDAPQLVNSSFDRWSQPQGSKNSWYPRKDESEAFWDSGNLGANTLSSVNPTEPEYNDVKDGEAAVKMTSRYVVVKFAAGNLYAGRFKSLNGTTPDMEFGQKFTSRPQKLKGWYKYNSQKINKGNHNGLSGKPDRFHIWMMVTTAKGMPRPHNGEGSPFDLAAIAKDGADRNIQALCFGEFHREEIVNGVDVTPALNMSAYESFTIDLKYFENNMSLEPQYIVVVMSASKYGDFFTGGEGAQLLVDKLELVYE